jgi:hypothetical protein
MSIPMSDTHPRPPRGAKYSWRQLAVGQSFVVEGFPIQSVSRQAIAAAKRIGFHFTFTCRTVTGGVRVGRDR